MSKFICIQNKGDFDPELVTIHGLSSKREDSSKIGQFGSGIKFSVAHMLRNNVEFFAFSGLHELRYSIKEKSFYHHQDNIKTSVIVMNGKELSMSIDATPDWKEWFNIREFWANALDEEDPTMFLVDQEQIGPKEGYTRWFIEYKPYKEIYDNWSIYYKPDAQNFEVWPTADQKFRVYKQGFLIYERELEPDESGPISVNWNDRALNELREIKDTNVQWDLCYQTLFESADARSIFFNACLNHEISNLFWNEHATYSYKVARAMLEQAPSNYKFFNKTIYSHLLLSEKDDVNDYHFYLVPNEIHRLIREIQPERCFPSKNMNNHGTMENDPESLNPEAWLLVDGAVEFLKSAKLSPDIDKYPIRFCHFSDVILGYAHTDGDTKEIWLSTQLLTNFEKANHNMFVSVIYEEYIHHATGYKDCTRKLQTFLFNQVLTQAKKNMVLQSPIKSENSKN